MAKERFPHPHPGAQPRRRRSSAEGRTRHRRPQRSHKSETGIRSVDEALVVVNGKNLNRLEANALNRSRAFKRLRLRWPQRERSVVEDLRASILGKRSREYICLSGKGAFISALCGMERALGSRAELPQSARHFPIERGPAGRDKAAGLFRSEDIREPAPTPAKALSSAPQGGPFSSASRRAAVSTSPAKTGFLHICEA
jgi:hypothetical protein